MNLTLLEPHLFINIYSLLKILSMFLNKCLVYPRLAYNKNQFRGDKSKGQIKYVHVVLIAQKSSFSQFCGQR